MDMRLTLILFIAAHALGFYYFPSVVRDGSIWGFLSGIVFYMLSILLVFAPALDFILFLYAMTLLLFHLLAELPFTFLRRRWKGGVPFRIFFFAEEILHLVFFAVLAYIYSARWTSPSPWRSVRAFLNQAALDYSQVLSFICLVILLLLPAIRLIRMLLPDVKEDRVPISGFAGCAERLLYAMAFYMGSMPACAIIFAVRSLIYTPVMIRSGEKAYRVLAESCLSALSAFAVFTLVSPFIHY